MKEKISTILIIFLISSNSYCNTIEEIKKSIFNFLILYEDCIYTEIDAIPYYSIIEIQKKKPINECKTGIFIFNLSYGYIHFILIEEDKYEIINMRDALDDNLKKLLIFFEENQEYSKSDVLFYLSQLIRIEQRNNNYTPGRVTPLRSP